MVGRKQRDSRHAERRAQQRAERQHRGEDAPRRAGGEADQRGHHAGNKDKQQQTDGEVTGGGDGDQVKATAHRGGLHQPQQTAKPADDPAH